MNELELYRQKKLEKYKREWAEQNAIHGGASPTSQSEYNKMKSGQKKTTTRRTHARGNHWNHYNMPRVKSDMKYWWK